MHRPCMTNLLAAAAVSLVVSASVGSASPTPQASPPTHGIGTAVIWRAEGGPSTADKLAALSKRVDRLQVKLNETRDQADLAEANVETVANCLIEPIYVEFDSTGDLVGSSDIEAPESFAITSVDAGCFGDAS